MGRLALLGVLASVVVGSATAGPARTLRGDGLTLMLPSGWHGLTGPGGFHVADFPLPQRARSSANLVRVPLALRRRDLSPGIEGFDGSDAYVVRTASVEGEMLEIVADLGPKPFTRTALRKANAVLGTLHVLPARVLRPRGGRLASDGVAVRLLPGWSGHVEIPADHYGARIVLRAEHRGIHVELLEIATAGPAPRLRLPISFTSRDVFPRGPLEYAHRAFFTAGRSFDLSVAVRSVGDLREADRFLSTLTVTPRPWTFLSCNLTLRLPGTWRVAVRPRTGCYPLLKLRGPRVLVALTELRPGERETGRILRRAGRRFHVRVTPASARARADFVLSTLRARPRS